jgi:SAM-dependent methyltransferase
MNKRFRQLNRRLYNFLCGTNLSANLCHFQFLPVYYFRRDIRADGPMLTGRLLDLGCGSKPYLPFLRNIDSYIGLEYPTTGAHGVENVKPEVYGDGRRVPFKGKCFDAVSCFQVLEHIDQPEQVVQEILRVLRPQGQGIISVPFIYNVHLNPFDFFRFSPFGIRDLLGRNGLKVQRLRYQGGIGTAIVQMFHNWLFGSVLQLAKGHIGLEILQALVFPFLILLCTLDNLVGLALDRLAIGTELFSPNLWIFFERE